MSARRDADDVSGSPRVTCLISTYNYGHFLPRAIDSVLRQTYPAEALDIVVVDDGSTDDTAEVVQPYLDRVHYVHKENGGLLSTLNRGLDEVKGELIAFLSADDEWHRDKLSKQVDFLAERPDVGLVYTDMEIVDDQGSLLQPSFWASHSIEPCRGQILGRLARGNVVSGGPIVVRAALLDAFHPIPDLAPFEDWWMAVRVAEIAEIDFIPEPLYVYRFHGENMNLWAEGEKRTKALADEIPFRRWMLTNLTDRIPVGDGLAALQALDEVIGTLAQARDVSPSDVVEVSAEDCATAGGARQAAAGAWRSLDYESAARCFLSALGSDPADNVSRAMLGAVGHGLPWPNPAPVSEAPAGPLVSIVVPVRNRLELTRDCLETIALTADVPHEVIVVDNGSTDGTSAYLRERERSGELRAVLNSENLGFGRACNQGLAAASGEYVVFLNNDTIALPGWLERLVAAAEGDPGVGAVGSRLLYPDWAVQHAGIRFSPDARPFHVHRGVAAGDPAVLEPLDYPALTGACLLLSKELLDTLGGFDESYHMYVEDVDLCLRVWEAGLRVRYCPESVVIHLENASVSDTDWRDRNVLDGLARLWSRWAGRWPARVLELQDPDFAPPGTSPIETVEGARGFATLAFAAELRADPGLLPAYAECFSESDEATMVIDPGELDVESLPHVLADVLRAAGLDDGGGADLLGLAGGSDVAARGVHAVYTRDVPGGLLAGLPRFDAESVRELRQLAESSWASG